MNDEHEYKAYRLDVKKRLNTPYHKQIIELKKLEKAGQDFNLISAGIATPQERMEQLKVEFNVGVATDFVRFPFFNFLFFCNFRISKKNTDESLRN